MRLRVPQMTCRKPKPYSSSSLYWVPARQVEQNALAYSVTSLVRAFTDAKKWNKFNESFFLLRRKKKRLRCQNSLLQVNFICSHSFCTNLRLNERLFNTWQMVQAFRNWRYFLYLSQSKCCQKIIKLESWQVYSKYLYKIN